MLQGLMNLCLCATQSFFYHTSSKLPCWCGLTDQYRADLDEAHLNAFKAKDTHIANILA